MEKQISSKDYWYISIVSFILSIAITNPFSSFGLLIVGLIMALRYRAEKHKENRENYLYLNMEKINRELEKLKSKKKRK